MPPVTQADIDRTREVLAELAARQDALAAELEVAGVTSFTARQEWLAARRTPDEALVWVRRWELPMTRPARVTPIQQPRRTTEETLAELDWLLSNGATAWEAAHAIQKSAASASRWAYRHNRPDLAVRLDEKAIA